MGSVVKERRRHLRDPVAWPIRLWLGENFFLVGRALDASVQGIRAILSGWVPGEILKFGETYRLELHATSRNELGCIAEIRHMSGQDVGLRIVVAMPRLLIVDDDPMVGELLMTYFATKGYRVAQAVNAADAFAAVQQDCPDLVLLDVGLPQANGLVVLRRLRREHPGIGVIMITGNQDPALARASRQMGAIDHVCKPFDLERLDHIVTASVRMARPVDLWASLR
jgi:CheY-like chemotaxis protein